MKGEKKPQISQPISQSVCLDSSSAMSGNLKKFISLPYTKTIEAMGQRERERWLLNWIGRAQLKLAQLHIWGKIQD